MQQFDNIIEFVEYFSTEKICREYYVFLRWGASVSCPHCSGSKVYTYNDNIRYKCANCSKQFRATTGTIFEHSNIPLRKWFMAYYLISTTKKGISSIQLGRQLKITQKSAWYMLQKIRFANVQRMNENLMTGIVEADETYIGGKRKFSKRGRGAEHKTPVFGLLNRAKDANSKSTVRIWPVENVKGATLKEFIYGNVKKGSKLMTDEFRSYNGLNKDYIHEFVSHAAHQYVNGEIHTNSIEGVWSLLKRSLKGIYHSVSKKHLKKYCAEFEFRFNTRELSDISRFKKALTLTQRTTRFREIISSDK